MRDVGERIALGFAEAERHRRANVPGAELLEIDGLLLALANVREPSANSVGWMARDLNRLAGRPTDRDRRRTLP
jgi:hypothetical protein